MSLLNSGWVLPRGQLCGIGVEAWVPRWSRREQRLQGSVWGEMGSTDLCDPKEWGCGLGWGEGFMPLGRFLVACSVDLAPSCHARFLKWLQLQRAQLNITKSCSYQSPVFQDLCPHPFLALFVFSLIVNHSKLLMLITTMRRFLSVYRQF